MSRAKNGTYWKFAQTMGLRNHAQQRHSWSQSDFSIIRPILLSRSGVKVALKEALHRDFRFPLSVIPPNTSYSL
jgi:hypothetical protein